MKRFDVTSGWRGSRLDRFVRAHMPGTPFSVIQILLRKGLIYLNGERAGGGARLKGGDVVSIDMIEASDAEPAKTPEKGVSRRPAARPRREKPSKQAPGPPAPRETPVIGEDIPILYEDGDILVLDKPPGVLVQPGNRKERGSLLDSLEEYRRRGRRPAGEEFARESKRSGRSETAVESTERSAPGEPPFPYTPVHRLDRETSGALVVAKTRPAARALSRSFAKGEVRKIYLAVVEGVPAERDGTIGTPLATRKGERSRSEPSREGKGALTHYAVIRKLRGGRSLLQVAIETGRTHQIRAHLASIGHPVAGDREYGTAEKKSGGRFLLHAWMVYFPHPATGEMLLCTAPPPRDIPTT